MFNRVLNKRLEIDNNQHFITLFHANVPFLHPLKTPENLWFSHVFREYKNRALA